MAKQIQEQIMKKHYILGCCGIDCGLCPRFYTDGDSKCPGCYGPDFENKHPPCGIANCCFKKNRLEVCSLCNDYPRKKYENTEKTLKDSFVHIKKYFKIMIL